MSNREGVEAHGSKEVADVFADFYEDPFGSHWLGENIGVEEGKVEEDLPDFTPQEVQQQLKLMGEKKTEDSAAIFVEMLQRGGEQLAEVLADILRTNHERNCEATRPLEDGNDSGLVQQKGCQRSR